MHYAKSFGVFFSVLSRILAHATRPKLYLSFFLILGPRTIGIYIFLATLEKHRLYSPAHPRFSKQNGRQKLKQQPLRDRRLFRFFAFCFYLFNFVILEFGCKKYLTHALFHLRNEKIGSFFLSSTYLFTTQTLNAN